MKFCNIAIYYIMLCYIILWYITIVKCHRLCDVQIGEKKCCIHYQYVNGTCIECPKGWFGDECRMPCPDGFYGVFCKGTCNCTADQICDVQEGCVHKKAVECSKGFFGEECKLPCNKGFYGVSCKETCNCTTDQICEVQEGCVKNSTDNILTRMESTSTEHETTKSKGYHEGIRWNHLYVVPLGVVIIVLIILLVRANRKKNMSGQEDESRHDQQDQEAGPQAVELNQNVVQSDYAEICEVNTTYSHNLTFSSDYNELSFSRSRWDRSELVLTESHYDTSKNCLLKIKKSESESKPVAEGDPYSQAKPLTDTGNEVQQAHVSEVKEGNVE